MSREFLEEVNLKIKALKIYRVFDYVSLNDTRHTIELVYLVELVGNINDLTLSSSHDDFKWISLEELNTFNLDSEIKANLEEGFEMYKKYYPLAMLD